MVSTGYPQYGYIAAPDSELDALLRGENVVGLSDGTSLPTRTVHVGETGVFIAPARTANEPQRPLALVVRKEDVRRLCGRYAQLRPDLSPLTAWCHLLTPNILSGLDGIANEPTYRGTEAAWSGLVVAETMLLTRLPIASIRMSACLASATYAVGRTKGLWAELALDEILGRFDVANKLCRRRSVSDRNQERMLQVRSSFAPMWTCLSTLTSDKMDGGQEDLQPLVMALAALQEARLCRAPNEAGLLVRPLLEVVPEARTLERLEEMVPEARLRVFDDLADAFKHTAKDAFKRRHALALAAGYVATVAAGGATSLSLVEKDADRWPELTGWAYLIGGIGERVTWTSGFDGLGRLVARELQRRLRLDEPPTCDFSLDEAVVLWDTELRDPLVHLKIKQARVLNVALFPGVNIAIPIVDTVAQEGTQRTDGAPKQTIVETGPQGVDHGGVLETLAAALWPLLRPLVIKETDRGATSQGRVGKGSQRSRARKKKGETSSQLALGKPRK